ncbi:hypothetical protein CUMW_280610 [Citrus unshiu]|uniref:Uncharacterized protein n=1 Tax=Citrus unshiu TaxID=55188 RepID=A0A2H5MUV8_CITUN|nr:hypothetical protein CUMW_280610 [Citrus unshiu]
MGLTNPADYDCSSRAPVYSLTALFLYLMCKMKPDGDSMCGSLTLTNKPNYKAFKFSDNLLEMRTFKRDIKSNLAVHRQNGNAAVTKLSQVNNLMASREPKGNREIRKRHYSEKNPMESDTPELVAFFEEQDYQFVKDIFMDREVPLMNKCLVENCELDHKIISCVLSSDDRESDNGTLEAMSSMSNESKIRIENDTSTDVTRKSSLENWMLEHEDDSDATSCSAEIADDNSYSSEATSESEVESGSLNTTNSEEEFQNQADSETEITFKPLDEISQSLTGSGQSVVDQHDQVDPGEPLSFSACVEQVPCTGSNSLRSSSSSASLHSFAFPILPSEWNGSPVRMC